ncbi:YtxH domain-containing protein [Rudanella lutea]|uniref:YtxH domain-containing protein n=1 Tax=Rudanella lutea TaxID=451374 RepID=UPI00036A1CA6|nr:YtxH domain-containing protein [Rudanella lutea]
MAVNAKHLATFILGAAAGAALTKYLQTEEGEKLMADLKEKGNQFKSEAEAAVDNAPEYFDNLRNQLADMLKNNFPNAEQAINDILGKKPELPTTETPNPSPTSPNPAPDQV